jgi:hypothetical protein
MLPEDREARLRCYRKALGQWPANGFVVPKRRVEEWLRIELPRYSWRELHRELHEHVANGGKIDEQVETRPEYAHYEFHYDLRVKIGGRHLYFETVLFADDPDDPTIVVVNVHDV